MNPNTSVTIEQIQQGIDDLGLAELPLCVHSSLKSFGCVEGGARTVVDGLLAAGCTVVVPTFSDVFAVPPSTRPARNAYDYERFPGRTDDLARVYTPATGLINRTMGAIPAAVVDTPGRVRGDHALNSFCAIGLLADQIIGGQAPRRVYAPIETLAALGGWVVLMGVGLSCMTLIHLAEQQAGRNLFIRWANGPDREPIELEVGSCSRGFPKLESVLGPLAREIRVGNSRWRAFPAAEALRAASQAIRDNPEITRCDVPTCERCSDAIAGGPIL